MAAATLQVVGIGGTVKKIAAKDLNRTMGADAAWFSSNASVVAVNDFLSFANEDYVLIQAGQYVDLKFAADTGGSNGQGTSVPSGLDKVTVQSVSGTCKGLRAADATQSTLKTDAYSSGSAFTLNVNDSLNTSDMAVCNTSGNFTLRFVAVAKSVPYQALAAVRMYTLDR
jgi:hypothetical protein